MAVTHQSGFPQTANVAASPYQLSVTTIAVGDLLVVMGRISATTTTVTAVTGGNATNWTKVIEVTDATNTVYLYMWIGTVTAVGTANVVLTLSGTPAIEIDVESFTAGFGAGTVWTVDTTGQSAVETPSTSTTLTYPSLTPSTGGELYMGYIRVGQTSSAGSTSGYTYSTLSNSNQLAWNATVAAGVATQPTASQSPAGIENAIGAVLGASGPQRVPSFLPQNLGPKAVGPTFFAPLPPPGTLPQPPGVWLPPTTTSSPRNRTFFVARGRQVKPPPAQEQPIVWQQPRSPRREPGRRPLGQRPFPVQAQIPVPPTVPGNRQPAGRRWAFPVRGRRLFAVPAQDPVWPTRIESIRARFTMLRRGRQVTSIPAQVPVPSPVWPNRTSALARRLFALVPRGKRPLPTPPQIAVPPTIPGNRQPTGRRWQVPVRGRRWFTPAQEPVWPTRIESARRAKFSMLVRGRRVTPTQPQVPVPAPVWPTRTNALRNRTFFLRKGRQFSPTPAQEDPSWPTRVAPSRSRNFSLRRGRQVVPPVPQQVPVLTPVWPTRVSMLARKLFVLRPRGSNRLPVQPQVPVPPTVPGNRQPTGRRALASGRRRVTAVIAAQDFSPKQAKRAVRPLLRARWRRTDTVPVQDPPPTKPRSRRWLLTRAKVRQGPPVPSTAPLAPAWPPRKLGATRRLLGAATRGRRADPGWPQATPPVNPPWVPQPLRYARRVLLAARGRRSHPWAQAVARIVSVLPGTSPGRVSPTQQRGASAADEHTGGVLPHAKDGDAKPTQKRGRVSPTDTEGL